MRVTESKKVERVVLVDIICDSCGDSCQELATGEFNSMSLSAQWGYGSPKDTEQWSADICEKCVDEKLTFVKFKREHIF